MVKHDKKYSLGEKYQKVILNKNEAICMLYLSNNFNVEKISKKMKLSSRTIAFYIRNVMLQLKCETLQELVHCIRQSELMNFD